MSNLTEWMNKNIYHTTRCDRRLIDEGVSCECGKDEAIRAVQELEDGNKRLREIIDELKGCE